MIKMFLAAAAAVAVAGCGESLASVEAVHNQLANGVDEKALKTAVDQAVDGKALEQAVVGTAKAAADRAVQDAIREVVPVAPADLGPFANAIDEKALVEGVGGAINADALAGAAKGAAGELQRK